MTVSRALLSFAALASALTAGCSDQGAVLDPAGSSGTGDPVLTRQTADAVVAIESIVLGMIDGQMGDLEAASAAPAAGPGSGAFTLDLAFDRTRPCPLGGEVSIAGELHDSFELETLTRETTFSGTLGIVGCAVRPHEEQLTLDGNADWYGFRRRVSFLPDGLQTATYSGMITATPEEGEPQTCVFDLEALYDPQDHTGSLTVSVCGDEFTTTVSWGEGGS